MLFGAEGVLLEGVSMVRGGVLEKILVGEVLNEEAIISRDFGSSLCMTSYSIRSSNSNRI